MKRNLTIDLIRIIAIVGVLVVHVTSKSLSVANFDILRLPVTFYIEILSRFAVPLFFIVSGYILFARYHHNLNTLSFYKRRISRLGIPYLLWSSFYIFYDMLKGSPISLFGFVDKLINGSAAIHLYFIPAILLLYFFFPILKKYLYFINKKIFILLTLIEVLLLSIDYFVRPIVDFTPLRIALLNLYLFIMGMLTVENEKMLIDTIQKRIKIILFTLFLCGVVLIYEIQALYLSSKKLSFISSQWQATNFLYVILIWGILFTFFQTKLLRYGPIIITLSKLSLFVFFVHMFYLNLFWRVLGSYLLNKSMGRVLETMWFTPIVFLFVLGASYLSAYLVSIIPKMNKFLGIE